jgi:putative DNA primase/helicase
VQHSLIGAEVQCPLVWLGEADPVKSMEEARDEDPVRRRIAEFFDSDILALNASYTTRQIAELATGRDDEVEDLLKQVGGENGTINNVALGKWLKGITGKIVNGRQLLRDTSDKARPKWALVERR